MQDFYDFVLNRRSIRHFREQTIAQEQIVRILKAGMWAPSAHNAQPWRFYILNSSTVKEKLAKAMSAEFRRDLINDGESAETIDSLVHTSVNRFVKAPVLLLVCLTMESMDSYPDERRTHAEYVMGVQSVAAAIQNILLAVHAEGLSGCWFCAPLFCQEVVKQVLGVSEDILPQALITIGLSDENPDPPPRFPIEKIIKVLE